MPNKFEQAGKTLLEKYPFIIFEPRKSISGSANYKTNIIKAPLPKTWKSFEIFAHEIGHLVANPDHKAPSWKKELQASEFALKQFKDFGFKITNKLKRAVYGYIAYSVAQALNRKMKHIPKEARKYCYGRLVKVSCINGNGDFLKYAWRAKF